jgi:hypothetical protein
MIIQGSTILLFTAINTHLLVKVGPYRPHWLFPVLGIVEGAIFGIFFHFPWTILWIFVIAIFSTIVYLLFERRGVI